MSAAPNGQRLTLAEYLAGPETNQLRELTWGAVRQPPAPSWDHQFVVGRLFVRLDTHVTRLGLGKVGVAPVDVILDPTANLVLQPDLVFVAAERCGIIRDRVWGAPDLVVEVASHRSRRYDRDEKRTWYARYGVRELWLVDPHARAINVCDLLEAPDRFVTFTGARILRSRVLPRLRLRPSAVFETTVGG